MWIIVFMTIQHFKVNFIICLHKFNTPIIKYYYINADSVNKLMFVSLQLMRYFGLFRTYLNLKIYILEEFALPGKSKKSNLF